MEELAYVGVLCVEFFLTADGKLLVNEIAPRPHNSGHLTIDACVTSQFEQQVRAVCGLPLGATDAGPRPPRWSNLLGDLWQRGEPRWDAALAVPDVKLHLYGKREPQPRPQDGPPHGRRPTRPPRRLRKCSRPVTSWSEVPHHMLRILFRLALVTLALLAPAAPAAAQSAAILAEIDQGMERYRLDAHIPGMVWGMVKDGRLVHVKGAGVQDVESKRPVTADTLFRIASMTKAFTALSVLKLRDDGKLALDAPAETYVPELRGWRYPPRTRRRSASASSSPTPPASSPTIRGAIGRRRCPTTSSRAC